MQNRFILKLLRVGLNKQHEKAVPLPRKQKNVFSKEEIE